MANTFVVSVANAILRDPTTLEGLAYGKANLTSAFTLTMQATDVRGGINNPLLFKFLHDKALDISIESAIVGKTILALNVGTSVVNGTVTALNTECIVLTGDTGALTSVPTGDVSVFFPDGTIQTVTAAGSAITVSNGLSQKVDAVYEYSVSADRVSIGTTVPPKVVDMTLIAEVRDNTNSIVEYMHINIPRFQVDGNYTLNLSANGVSTESIKGSALSVVGVTCADGDTYGYVTWVPVATSAVSYSYVVALPSTLSFSVAAGLPSSKAIALKGIRGGTYEMSNLTTNATYVKTSGCASITVGSATGIVTAGSAAAASHVALITATYYNVATSASLTDAVNVVVTA